MNDERLAAALDKFQETAGQYALDKVGGSSREEHDAYRAMMTARVELVQTIIRIESPAVFGAHIEDTECPGPCETHHPTMPDVLTDRQGVLDAFAERLAKIEDWIYIQDPHWQGRPEDREGR